VSIDQVKKYNNRSIEDSYSYQHSNKTKITLQAFKDKLKQLLPLRSNNKDKLKETFLSELPSKGSAKGSGTSKSNMFLTKTDPEKVW